MKITWLGQAGLLFEADGKRILIDPYLSDSVRIYEPQNYRRQPIEERFLAIRPDVILVTHNHLDHLDKETLQHYLTPDAKTLVLAPDGAWQELRRSFPSKGNYVLFNRGTTWSEGGLRFRAVSAEHSDPNAIGVILSEGDKHYYVTGDTLYSERVFESLPPLAIEALFLPINGRGNNMNKADAAAFAARVAPRYTVPMHFGLLDELTADDFTAPGKLIPSIYESLPIHS